MEQYFDKLAKELLEKNQHLSYEKARTWVELLWEDFETTYAKAGRKYRGKEVTEQIVRQWIQNYGENLHEFVAKNQKYAKFFKDREE
ncbi:YfhJ family protein [Bacillus alveayuensis]|uniref:YfhJ family protein n=1 Tax=Aeribacillus alveayuensis TaxID=279215 RepID=UPI0005CD0AC8|nr:YfhJ family protein [Bacillus alveayuensis]